MKQEYSMDFFIKTVFFSIISREEYKQSKKIKP